MNTCDFSQIKQLASTVRMLSAAGVERAKSGHPGMPLGAADYASLLWAKQMRFNPSEPTWINRDRFVLSAGHGSMLLYSLLNLFGYDLPIEELKNFRQWESRTPGHPEFGMTTGVETTTGPLGQGISNAVGMALSQRMLAARYSDNLFNYRVFGICSDGDLMEGVSAEAASLAGHWKLSNLIFFYDDNHISIGGTTEVCFTEDVAKRFEAYGWYVQRIDGHNYQEIQDALDRAVAQNDKPALICARTIIGKGSPNKCNDPEVHGAPLGAQEFENLKKELGWQGDEFTVPAEVASYCSGIVESNKKLFSEWTASFLSWSQEYPSLREQLNRQFLGELPEDLLTELLAVFDDKKDATRNLSGKAIQVIAQHLPGFIGGSADLEPSTKTLIKDSPDITAENFIGKNLRFGVREHAMGAIANGLAYCGCWFPYTATFLVFADYMRPTLRLAALSHIQTLFIFTHDSFWVGEDGPTHQPIEHIASLRIIPNLYVYRPADGVEVAACYYAALQHKSSPSALLFTRQNLPALPRPENWNPQSVLKGAYIVWGFECEDLVIVATGSEVALAIDAAKLMAEKGIACRVVSMPCVELFLEQEAIFRNQILPLNSKRVSLEAGITSGWERIVGCDGLMLGRDVYGASAPGEVLAQKFGFTPDTVAKEIVRWLQD